MEKLDNLFIAECKIKLQDWLEKTTKESWVVTTKIQDLDFKFICVAKTVPISTGWFSLVDDREENLEKLDLEIKGVYYYFNRVKDKPYTDLSKLYFEV